MPSRARLAPCLEPGCAELTLNKRCHTHTQTHDKTIPRQGRSVYNNKQWRALRKQIMRRDPWCKTPGCNNLTRDIDHIVPIQDGGAPYDPNNLQGLCAKHHGIKTAQETWGRK